MRISTELSPYSFLSQRLSYARRNAIDVVNLVENVPSWPTPPAPAAAAVPEMLTYAPAEGADALLDALASRENRQIARAKGLLPDLPGPVISTRNILVTNGATQAISLILQSLPSGPRTILCQSPVFIGIVRLMTAHGFNVLYLPADQPIAAATAAMMSDKVAAIYLNSPNNPTGTVVPAAEISKLLTLAKTWKARVLIDAVYEDFCFDGVTPDLPRQPGNNQLYLVNSISKNYGAPGLRVGWIVSSAANIEVLGGQLERECVAVGGYAQLCAATLLSRSNAELVAHVERSRAPIYAALKSVPGLTYFPTSAGTQLLAHLDVPDIEAFADFSLLKHGLILATTSNYGGLNSQSIRIPLGLPRGHILNGIPILAQSLTDFGVATRSVVHAT